MLSDKEIVCPNNLLNVASQKKGIVAGIVNAGNYLAMVSVMDAVNENLIKPIFIGNKDEINKCAEKLKFVLSVFEVLHDPVDIMTAKVAACFGAVKKIQIK